MASYRNASHANVVVKSLGKMVGLLLSLYVFDRILTVVFPIANASTYFGSTAAFVNNLFPVLGILGAFAVIWEALAKTGLV